MIRRVGGVVISPQAGEYRSLKRRAFVMGSVVVCAFGFAYAGVFVTLAGQWWGNNMYSYGFLIPFISGYLSWDRRKELSQIATSPSYLLGFPVVLTGLSMLILGQAGGVAVLQEVSLVVTLVGSVLLVFGTTMLRALWFPIAYLLFMIPMWDVATERLHFPFQLFSATLGVHLLQLLGIPVLRQATFVVLPNITLEVAKVCSGVNYLIAVLAIAIPMAYIFLKGWWVRTLLVSFAVLIAALGNGVRVALIGLLSYHGMEGDIHGPFHVLQGLSVSMIGYGAIFGGLWVLSRLSSSVAANREHRVREPARAGAATGAIRYGVALLVVLFVAAGNVRYVSAPTPVPLKKDFREFPVELAGWQGIKIPGHQLFKTIGADRELSMAYHTASGERVELYIEYFTYQKQGKELGSYRTADYFQNPMKVEVALANEKTIEVNRVVHGRARGGTVTLFWYVVDGRVLTDRYKAKAYTAWDALMKGKNDGALIMLSADFQEDTEMPAVIARCEALIREVYDLSWTYLPTSSVVQGA